MKNELEKELKNTAPTLAKLQGKGDTFVPPKDYLEGLEAELWAKVQAESKTNTTEKASTFSFL